MHDATFFRRSQWRFSPHDCRCFIQPPAGVNDPDTQTYATLLKSTPRIFGKEFQLKPVETINGESMIIFEPSDIQGYIKEENLQYALAAKFSYGRPTMTELGKFFPHSN